MFNIKSYKFGIFILLILPMMVAINSCNVSDPPIPDPGIIEVPTDELPAWSPDGKYIAFNHFNPHADENTHPFGLYLLNLETGERTLIIEGIALSPDWSPDGEWIAFNSGDIFKIRPDGSDLHKITNIGNAFFPAWSINGDKIAFDTSHENERGANTIWIISHNGNNMRKIVDPVEGEIREPVWSPDGLYFLHYRYILGKSGSEIFKIDTTATTTKRLTLTEDGVTNRSASWSPDGYFITWQKNHELWIMRSDGSEQQYLSSGLTPSWSPDSERIVFSKPNSDESKIVLWTINRDGSGLQQITF